jgi:hypothetical protein
LGGLAIGKYSMPDTTKARNKKKTLGQLPEWTGSTPNRVRGADKGMQTLSSSSPGTPYTAQVRPSIRVLSRKPASLSILGPVET